MKHKLMILFVFAFGMLVWSCGDDDPKVNLPDSIKDSKIYSYGITSPAGAALTLEKTLKISDFTGLGTNEKYVTKGELNVNSYIDFVKGAAGAVELKDVTLQIKNNSKIKYILGTISGDERFNSLEDLEFLQLVVNEMISKKETVLQISFNTTNAITTPVNLNFNLDITFRFQ